MLAARKRGHARHAPLTDSEAAAAPSTNRKGGRVSDAASKETTPAGTHSCYSCSSMRATTVQHGEFKQRASTNDAPTKRQAAVPNHRQKQHHPPKKAKAKQRRKMKREMKRGATRPRRGGSRRRRQRGLLVDQRRVVGGGDGAHEDVERAVQVPGEHRAAAGLGAAENLVAAERLVQAKARGARCTRSPAREQHGTRAHRHTQPFDV